MYGPGGLLYANKDVRSGGVRATPQGLCTAFGRWGAQAEGN